MAGVCATDEGEAEAVALARANWLAVLVDALGGRIDPEAWDRLMRDERAVAARAPAPALANGLPESGRGRVAR